ncbi:hypothetical protein UlMin_021086 [Ulmus minor]
MTEYKPISLCNVLYKIISKTLTDPFREVIGDRKKMNKEGFLALKLDMSKAYDKVEWGCLMAIMDKLGFSPNWILKVMGCISLFSYYFWVNGTSFGPSISHLFFYG